MDICTEGQRRKLNVLFLSYNGLLEPLLYSQGIVYLRELTKTLNIEIVVLSFEKVGFPVSPKQREELKGLREKLLKDNIVWFWLRYHKSPAILSSLFDICLGIIRGGILISRKKISFIHARSYVPGTIAFILSKIFKIEYIFDMRGFMIDDYVALNIIPKDGLIHRVAKRIEKIILKDAYRTIVLTREAHMVLSNFREFRDGKSKNIDIIPCCVDTKRFSSYANKDSVLLKRLGLENKCIFIYLGSLGKLYQLKEMLDFFKIVRNSIPNAYFLILTPDIKEIIAERSRYKNMQLFEHIGYLKISPEEIGKYIALADVGIAFYLPSFANKATCPTKIGEYLACGIPFIINRGVGDTEEWVNKYGVGVVINDFNNVCYKEAAEKIFEIIKDKDYIHKKCRQAANDLLSLEIAKEKYGKVYGSLFHERAG